MSIINTQTGLAIMPALFFLASCTSQAPAPSATDVTDAAETIVKETVYVSTLFTTCASLGGEQEIMAIDKQQDWTTNNGELAAAADTLYSQRIAATTIDYDGKRLSPAAIYLAKQARQRALDELGLSKRSANNQRKTCDFRLAKITVANSKLSHQPTIAAAHADIMKSAPSRITPIQAIPTLAANINLDTPPGRTYYSINKALEKECNAPFTLTLVNQWPNEAYANFCGNNLVDTLMCEWGKCEAKRL